MDARGSLFVVQGARWAALLCPARGLLPHPLLARGEQRLRHADPLDVAPGRGGPPLGGCGGDAHDGPAGLPQQGAPRPQHGRVRHPLHRLDPRHRLHRQLCRAAALPAPDAQPRVPGVREGVHVRLGRLREGALCHMVGPVCGGAPRHISLLQAHHRLRQRHLRGACLLLGGCRVHSACQPSRDAQASKGACGARQDPLRQGLGRNRQRPR
mmetsp:Transcript_23383/g.58667  ORF Transcript_23383/g.58667 Transcript_23383/m.58667 type:complete len:211 (-) Transcript_23383:1165-1797(-)